MFINIISHFFCTEIQFKKKRKEKNQADLGIEYFFPSFSSTGQKAYVN